MGRGNGSTALGQVVQEVEAARQQLAGIGPEEALPLLLALQEQQLRLLCALHGDLGALATQGISSVPQPHLEPPPGSEHQDLPANRLPVAIVAGGSAVLVTWPAVRQKSLGVVRRFGIVVTAGALADLRYSFRKNGRLFGYFEQMRGSAGTLEEPQEVLVELAAGDVFDVLAENTGVAAISVAARAVGWFWFPEEALA